MKKEFDKKFDYSTLTEKEMLALLAYEILRLGDGYTVEQIVEYKQEILALTDISDDVRDYLLDICNHLLLKNVKKYR